MSSTPPATASGQPPPQSNAQLAVLLAQAYQDIESLRTERDNALHRAENAQALFTATTSAASGPGSSGGPSNDAAAATISALQNVNESQLRTISDLTARLKAISDHWSAYERWGAGIDVRTADARLALGRSINGLTNTSDGDAIASASSPLPFKDVQPFQNPSLSRRQSRATLSSHPALQIPPGAPGGRPTSSAGVPSNLPPIPSGVVAGRIRPRDSSIPRRRSDDEPGSATFRRDPLDPTAAEERPHRQSTDDTDSTGDAVEGERQRKRLRADAGPAALSTSAAPNIARRDRARFNDSPGGAHFPQQFAFPHNQPQYGQTDMPPPPEYRFPKPQPGAEVRQRGSEPGILPPQLHIAERSRHGPRGNSDTTLASAMTPTSAILTPMTGRSSIPSGSKDSFPMTSPHPRPHHRYSRSSGDIRADSMGDPGGIMGVPRSDSPNPIEGGRRFPPFDRQDSSMSIEGGRERDKDRSLGMPRQELERRSRQTAEEGEHERMDVDGNVDPRLAEGDQGRVGRASVGRRGRATGTELEDDERDSVDEFLNTALDTPGDDDRAGRGGDGEERDELQEDREMSPMSTQVGRTQSHSGQHLERWRQVDRERELRQREDEQRADSGPQMQYASSNGLVKIKNDQFRYYSTPEQLKQQHSPSTSPHLSSSHPQPQHGSTYPPPAFQTLAMQHGQLQQIRRGTIAGIVTTPNPRDEFAYQARASYSGPSHSRRPSGESGPPSSGLSHPSLVGPPSAGGPLSAGSGTHIIYPHSQQPRHTGPGPAVKPTLNAQGQRTCRQCGQPGRYKDGKCVEKWGPGPAGPGTVCDRCRKKMKRVERRGTQDAGSLGQHLPLGVLTSNQQQPQLSPRQYYPPQSQPSYPREGQQYSPSEVAAPPREFQFQTPLSAASSTWGRGSKDWSTEGRHGRTGSITTSPTSQQPKSNQPASAKPREKRRAPTYSPSPSPAQVEGDARSSKSASQPRSAEEDAPASASNASSSQQRKNSGDSMRSEMESAAEVLEEVAGVGDEVVSPSGTVTKEKDGEDDADGDGDMEDALGEEEDADAEPSANAGSGTGGPDSDQDRSQHSASVVPSPAPQPSRKTPLSRHPTSTPDIVTEKERNAKHSWIKAEDDNTLLAQG